MNAIEKELKEFFLDAVNTIGERGVLWVAVVCCFIVGIEAVSLAIFIIQKLLGFL